MSEIKKKIQDAILDMATKVEFIDTRGQHKYVNRETGEWLQGVSTVSNILPKDWLAAWGAKECAKALGFSDYPDTANAELVWAKIKTCTTVQEYLAIIKDAKGAGARKSKKAMVDGKLGHKWLELYVQSKINGEAAPAIPVTGMLERPIKQFLEWESAQVEYWIASEAKIVRPDKNYAGTLDAIAVLKNGQLALVDFKFASHISEDYYLQTAGYAAAFEPYGIVFDTRIILRLPKTLMIDEWDEKAWKYHEIENKMTVHAVPTRYESDRDAFFHALPLKGWINYVLNLNK